MAKLRERLTILNRPFTEIIIPGIDGENSEIAYYRRPTELEDNNLRKAMEEEQKSFLDQLKNVQEDADGSVYDIVLKQFEEAKDDVSLDYIMSSMLMNINQQTLNETGLKQLTIDSSQEDRDEFQEKFRPVFDRILAEKREVQSGYSHEQLAAKAAQAFIENKAATKAIEVYRRQVIARSLYEKDEENGNYQLVYVDDKKNPDPDGVAADLDSSTLTYIANKIVEEIEAAKTLPLRLAAKT